MIVTYYSHSKTLTIQVMEFEIFRTSKYVSKFQKFKSPLPHVEGGVMYITYTTKL